MKMIVGRLGAMLITTALLIQLISPTISIAASGGEGADRQTAEQVDSYKSVKFFDCDTLDGTGHDGTATSCELDTEDFKEGVASIRLTYSPNPAQTPQGNGAVVFYYIKNGITDASGLTCLEFDWYLEDPSIFTDNPLDRRIEISSGGTWQLQSVAYPYIKLANLPLKKGWNHIKLPLKDFVPLAPQDYIDCEWHWKDGVVGGECIVDKEPAPFDPSRMNYLRMYTFTPGDYNETTVMKIDNIMVTNAEPDTAEQIPGQFFSGDSLAGVNHENTADSCSLDTEDHREGSASVKLTYSPNPDQIPQVRQGLVLFSYTRAEAFDISGKEYVEFDWYIEDPSIFKNAGLDKRIEISSAGTWQRQSLIYPGNKLANLYLKRGWNHIQLPLKDFVMLEMSDYSDCEWHWKDGIEGGERVIDKQPAPFDPTRMNYFRIYSNVDGDYWGKTVMKFDNIKATVRKTYDKGGPTLMLFDCDSLDEIYTNAAAAIDTGDEGHTDGCIELQFPLFPENGVLLFYISMRNKHDLSEYTCIEFDLWLSDPTIFPDNGRYKWIRISSSGTPDLEFTRYPRSKLSKLELKQGWNHIQIPLSEFTDKGDGRFDNTRMNYFELYTALAGNYNKQVYMKFDNVMATKNKVDIKDEETTESETTTTEPTDAVPDKEPPATGERSSARVAMAAVVISIAGTVFAVKRKRAGRC